MKIALIDPVGGHGGMDFYDYGLAQGLGNNDAEVFYFTSPQTEVRHYPKVNTHLVFEKIWSSENKIKRLYFFLLGYYKSFVWAKKEGAKIVHFQFFDLGFLNFLVIGLASFFSFKKILTLHDVSSFKNNNSGWLENLILNWFDKIIVHNKLSYEELSRKIEDKDHIHIVPHGNYLPFVESLSYTVKKDGKLNLLFFGQIKKVKGLEILLHAMAQVIPENPNVHLTIAGKPWHEELMHYKELIVSLHLENHTSTHFEYVPNNAVASYFKEADVVVLPYKKIYQSGVLLLAMSYGRPVLASNLPAFQEIVEDGETGFLFENGNSSDLASEIMKIANNKQTLSSVKDKASELLQTKFDWSAIGLRTKEIYSSLK